MVPIGVGLCFHGPLGWIRVVAVADNDHGKDAGVHQILDTIGDAVNGEWAKLKLRAGVLAPRSNGDSLLIHKQFEDWKLSPRLEASETNKV